jgi:periplasmic protein TonB
LEASITHSKSNEHLLVWTLICSILLHAIIAIVVPSFDFTSEQPPKQELTVELVQPEKPQAVAEAAPERPIPAEPEPVKETPKPIKKTQKPVERTPLVEPITEPNPEPTPSAPPPEVIAVAPKTEVKPMFVAPPSPPPEPVKATGPSESDIDAARSAYRNQVQRELKRNQRYPKIAETRGIEGDVKLEISIDDDGNVTNVAVAESSGNSALDDAAIAAVKRSNLKQYMQDILRGYVDKITVTVGFKLA